ncbi:DUF7096 domain-containing protein [Halocatena marina]|uniref:Curli production assembly/transport component CsgG n=1 Tax=Halocatena marina TaxID=2934937 RepID=A0ABD5YNV7_9EURY|nr:hypothetical protein [Halocatena marina]
MRSPHLLLACALVLAPIAGVPLSATETNTPTASGSGTVSPGTIKRPINNSVSHLAINSTQINETGIETVTLDVSGAVAFDGSTFRREQRFARFQAAQKNASDPQEVVDSELTWAENRTDKLRTRQREAIENYNDGTLSAQAFLRELAAISAEANQLSVFVEDVGKNSDRSLYIKSEIDPLTGTVQSIIGSALQGDSGAPNRFFVQTSEQGGVVLATVNDGQYIREVYLPEVRDAPTDNRSYSYLDALNVLNKSYISIDAFTNDVGQIKTHPDHHRFILSPPYGSVEIRSFVDRSSGEIFYERQNLSISDKRTIHGPQNTSGPFTLETNTTYTGGYMIVRVNDPETDAEPNGTITVDGETVGTTEDGELHMLQPPNGSTINATVDGETVSVTVGKPMGPPKSGLSVREEGQNKWQQLGNILF